MANNTISFSLELRSDPHSMGHAAKLDRLVNAIERYRKAATVPHGLFCSARAGEKCTCGAETIVAELAAALAAIELPEDHAGLKQ